MAAMGARDMVSGSQVHANADRARLLARREMNESRDLRFLAQYVDTLFEGAYGPHPAVGVE